MVPTVACLAHFWLSWLSLSFGSLPWSLFCFAASCSLLLPALGSFCLPDSYMRLKSKENIKPKHMNFKWYCYFRSGWIRTTILPKPNYGPERSTIFELTDLDLKFHSSTLKRVKSYLQPWNSPFQHSLRLTTTVTGHHQGD